MYVHTQINYDEVTNAAAETAAVQNLMTVRC